jgi:hypothetical protein
MSTAAEIQLRMAEADRRLAPIRAALQQNVNRMFVVMQGRRVCARRARKLRKRGCCVEFFASTARGKRRYSWLPATFVFRSAT